jgi:hypothetical protein
MECAGVPDYVSGGRLAADASGCFVPGQEHAAALFDVTRDGSCFVSISAQAAVLPITFGVNLARGAAPTLVSRS